MLKFVLFALFLSFALSAKLQVANGANLFQINTMWNGSVFWTLNGNTYNHLQQLSPSCTDGATPISLGNGQWSCGPYDTLLNIQPNCSAFQVVKYINGTYTCASDNDALASINTANCSTGSVAKVNSNGQWTCQSDQNQLATIGQTIGCLDGQILIYNVSTWYCVNAANIPDSNIIGQLACGSSAGGANVVKFNATSGTFQCDFDIDIVPVCNTGQTLKYNGTTWLCANDSDTALALTSSCSPTNQYFKFVNGAWTCQPNYFNLVSKKKRSVEVFGGEIVVLNAFVANIGASGSLTTYPAHWGNENTISDSQVAPVLPINGSIYSVRLFLNNFVFSGTLNKLLYINLFVNGTMVGSHGINVPPAVINGPGRSFLYPLSPVYPFSAGASITANFNISSPISYKSGTVGFNFYLQV